MTLNDRKIEKMEVWIVCDFVLLAARRTIKDRSGSQDLPVNPRRTPYSPLSNMSPAHSPGLID